MRGLFTVFLLTCWVQFLAQPSWYLLNSSPTQNFRHDDVYFLNENLGWVVNVNGQVWKTSDGGTTWNQTAQQATPFRCVGFLDSLNGFIGNLGPGRWAPTSDTNPLYQTMDGGNTWTPVTNISGPLPHGICGLRIVNDSVIVACGRVKGQSYFMRSIDKGQSWISKSMTSYAGMLIDLDFRSADTGFVVGGTDSVISTSRALILYTSDGGNTWVPKITSSRIRTLAWKIERPLKNPQTYYVSVERGIQTDSLMFCRSLDGGATWTEFADTMAYPFSQGVGFLTDSVGWIGGAVSALSTSNAGSSFTSFNTFVYVNRIRFVNDSVGYAVGKRVYKFSNNAPVSVETQDQLKGYKLEQNYPNPFRGSTLIKYSIPRKEQVLLEVYDFAGRKVRTLVNESKRPGDHLVEFKLPSMDDEIFICIMNAGKYARMIRIISTK